MAIGFKGLTFGVEIEFSGVTREQAVQDLVKHFGTLGSEGGILGNFIFLCLKRIYILRDSAAFEVQSLWLYGSVLYCELDKN